jgi:hypothetical protein
MASRNVSPVPSEDFAPLAKLKIDPPPPDFVMPQAAKATAVGQGWHQRSGN